MDSSGLEVVRDKIDEDQDSENDALPEISEGDLIYLLKMDTQIVLDGQKLKSLIIPEWARVGAAFKLSVSQVSSPFKFWFLFHLHTAELSALMKNLNVFYNQMNTDELQIPPTCIKLNLICTALYEREWHRARIVEIINPDKVTVYYVDYGTTMTVPSKALKFLHLNFSEFPEQAFRGCLDNVRPIGGIWTHAACISFHRLISRNGLFAKITNINVEEKILYLNLLDCTKSNDLNISLDLIQKGFALFVKTSLYDLKKRHYSELYPTFDMLECGSYPSFQQIVSMLEHKFNFYEYQNSILVKEMMGYSSI